MNRTPDHNRLDFHIPEEVFRKCVHCGLCTSACPTYQELGDENDSPRGRIYLLRLIQEGTLAPQGAAARHLDLCLDCRACESACPSGVHYSRLIEPFRLEVASRKRRRLSGFDWFREIILLRVFPYPNRIRTALAPWRWLQHFHFDGWLERIGALRLLPSRLAAMTTLAGPPTPGGPRLPKFLPAKGRRRARVAFFVGCVADAMFRHVHWATLRVLQENGCDVVIPRDQVCCGAIHMHAGDSRGARRMADQNIAAFLLDEIDAVVVNHAGCGAMLKEYPVYWVDGLRDARARFSSKVRDINEFLFDLGMTPPASLELSVAYHDACHLAHAQGVRTAPRALVGQIPGIRLVPLPESDMCCGSAGTYNLLQPEMANRLVERKVDNILNTGAPIVLASNAGCMLQIARELRRRNAPVAVLHPMELLDWSYTGTVPHEVYRVFGRPEKLFRQQTPSTPLSIGAEKK
ncbi:MAG: (Fe-S)-binding protein [Planctomycetota bacterium]|nr:MAG: (Fe-S)-binding protein [Planctomycetota bacterium]